MPSAGRDHQTNDRLWRVRARRRSALSRAQPGPAPIRSDCRRPTIDRAAVPPAARPARPPQAAATGVGRTDSRGPDRAEPRRTAIRRRTATSLRHEQRPPSGARPRGNTAYDPNDDQGRRAAGAPWPRSTRRGDAGPAGAELAGRHGQRRVIGYRIWLERLRGGDHGRDPGDSCAGSTTTRPSTSCRSGPSTRPATRAPAHPPCWSPGRSTEPARRPRHRPRRARRRRRNPAPTPNRPGAVDPTTRPQADDRGTRGHRRAHSGAAAPDGPGPLVVQSDRTLLLEVDHPAADACRIAIAPFAELERAPEHIHTYRLTPLGLWNARAAGHDAEQVVDTLLTYSRYPVPTALLVDVADTMDRYGRLRIEKHPTHGLVLVTHRPAGADRGAAQHQDQGTGRRAGRRGHRGRAPVRARAPQAGAAQARLAGRGPGRLRRRRGARN